MTVTPLFDLPDASGVLSRGARVLRATLFAAGVLAWGTGPVHSGPPGIGGGTPPSGARPFSSSTPAPAANPAAAPSEHLMVRRHAYDPTTVMLFWSGPVVAAMPALIRAAFLADRDKARRFVLVLNSGGGSVMAGEQTIEVLREIRRTHRLDTEVRNGRICGSMCVFIYLQGDLRTAAPASAWLFHEITRTAPGTGATPIIDKAAWDRLIGAYYPSAGVSPEWTRAMTPHTINSDYWLSGRDLVEARSGIASELLSNTQSRTFIPGGSDGP